MKTRIHLWSGGLALVAILFLMSSCAPIFSELQSARTAGRNNFEVTAGFSTVNAPMEKEEGNTTREHLQDHIGLHVAYGLTENIDVRMRFEHLWGDNDGGNLNAIGFGPKIEVIENWLALYVPVGFAFGGDLEEKPMDTWEVHPTVLFSVPISKNFELNTSGKYIQALQKGGWQYAAVNLGLGISTDLTKYVIRPEVGWAWNIDGGEGSDMQFSIGTTFYPSAFFKQ